MVKLKKSNKLWVQQYLPYIMILVAIVGLVASFVLTADKIHVLKDPSFVPECNINPIISCGSVMTSKQAEIAGVPNTVLGLIGFSSLGTIGLMLLAGASFKRWFWRLVWAGTIFGLFFVLYLMYQSFFVIKSLCPYCMSVWATTILLFWYTTLYMLTEKYLDVPKKYQKIVNFAQKHHADVYVGIILLIIGFILYRFWYYWQTLI